MDEFGVEIEENPISKGKDLDAEKEIRLPIEETTDHQN